MRGAFCASFPPARLDKRRGAWYNSQQVFLYFSQREVCLLGRSRKFTREDLQHAAVRLIREGGPEALSARTLAASLDSSTRPIFTLYSGMDELLREVIGICFEHLEQVLSEGDAPLSPPERSLRLVQFARTEPGVFRLLFMQGDLAVSHPELLRGMDRLGEADLQAISSSYGLSPASARDVYGMIFPFVYGLCCLCATRTCGLADEQISKALNNAYSNLLSTIQQGVNDHAEH